MTRASDKGSKQKLVIIGAGEFAEIAYEYFTHDSDYCVVAFAVEKEYRAADTLFDLPVIDFEHLSGRYPSSDHEVFVAVTFTQLNRVRRRLFQRVKELGFRAATYVSSRAFVWRNATLGENCFIFENNVIQYHVRVGDNVIMWSGNHVGHRSVIESHAFLTSHVVVSGYCRIGESAFLGVNSTVIDRVSVAPDCIAAAGSVITRNTEPGRLYHGSPATAAAASSYLAFGVMKDEY